MTSVRGNGPQSVVVTFEDENQLDRLRASSLPNSRYNKKEKGWVCRASYRNLDRIRRLWEDASWDKEAQATWQRLSDNKESRERLVNNKEVNFADLDTFPFKTLPWDNQKTALLLGRNMPYFAYLMDQGTGKTKLLLDDAAHNYMEGRIDALLVLAPNSVKTNWVMWDHMLEEGDTPDAVDTHMSEVVPVRKAVWISASRKDDKREWGEFEDYLSCRTDKNLIILTVNYDAITLPRVFDFLEEFVKEFRTMICCDESTYIKTPGSKRTKAALKLRRHCPVARIMTGTPIIKRPVDAFAQFMFLDEDVLGFNSFYSFRNRYCVMGGYEFKQVVAYKNLDELSDKIASCSYRVMLQDCLDIPPKIYLPDRIVNMSKAQLKAYSTMRKDMFAEHPKGEVVATIALTQQMRLQEITGGYLPIIDEVTGERVGTQELVDPKNNPKFKEVLELVENSQQFIIWSCFHGEIDGLQVLLEAEGYKVAVFDGRVDDRDKLRIRKDYQNGKYDGVIANAQAGGMGIDEFKVADLSVYVSNQNGGTEGRMQSEARTFRGGMEHSCRFADVMVSNSVDIKIRRMIDKDVTLSQQIMKDGLGGLL